MLVIGLMSSLRGLLVGIFSMVSFVCASSIDSVSQSVVKHLSVLSAMSLQIRLVTTMLGVGGMVTEFFATARFVMQSFPQPSLLH